ncbi:MAG: ABC transporter ATP-binding protein [Desulfamplus sp.]|nr:ABC transporter ATP-binding protein [Desulfamplus sp.]
MQAIKIKNLRKSFGTGWGKRVAVLKDLSLEIKENEIFGYLGANGAGKTTTFKLILGLIHPDQGEVSFWGRPASDFKSRSLLGYLPENPYFYSYLTAGESLDFYASLFDIDAKTKKERIDELLGLVGLEHARDLQLRKFSRGMLQRVGIAQALINDPKLLILDEPMSGLDPMGRKNMRDIILKCREQGKTIIFSTHIISDVETVCDRASILVKGELKQIIDIEDILESEDNIWEIICQAKHFEIPQMLEKEKTEVSDKDAFIHDIDKTVSGNRILLTTSSKNTAYLLMDEVQKQNLNLISFGPRRKNLEEIYIKSTGQADQKGQKESAR